MHTPTTATRTIKGECLCSKKCKQDSREALAPENQLPVHREYGECVRVCENENIYIR